MGAAQEYGGEYGLALDTSGNPTDLVALGSCYVLHFGGIHSYPSRSSHRRRPDPRHPRAQACSVGQPRDFRTSYMLTKPYMEIA